MKENKAYLGITGITDILEIHSCIVSFRRYGLFNLKHFRPMLGFLMSYKYFFYPGEYYSKLTRNVPPEFLFQIHDVLKEFPQIFTTLHYYSKNKESFSREILWLLELWDFKKDSNEHAIGDPIGLREIIQGIQLNIKNPSLNEIKKIKELHPSLKIIYQYNDLSITPYSIKDYGEYIDYILIDNSLGKGKNINLYSKNIHNLYLALEKTFPRKILGFAGGMNGENIEMRISRINELMGKFNYSIDSESKLRNSEDILDFDKVNLYISNFVKAIKKMEK